jgi:hypothetical protein
MTPRSIGTVHPSPKWRIKPPFESKRKGSSALKLSESLATSGEWISEPMKTEPSILQTLEGITLIRSEKP